MDMATELMRVRRTTDASLTNYLVFTLQPSGRETLDLRSRQWEGLVRQMREDSNISLEEVCKVYCHYWGLMSIMDDNNLTGNKEYIV